MLSKKELVNDIRERLDALNTPKDGCQNLDDVPNVTWVSRDEVMTRTHLHGVLYKNRRYKLYSKDVSWEQLMQIRDSLDKVLV